MYVLAIDLETSGTDPEKDRITEVGAVLWDVVNQRPIQIINELILPDENDPPLSMQVVEINGITDDLLKKFGVPLNKVLLKLSLMVEECTFWVAHNLQFERSFLTKVCDFFENVPHIDTMTDIVYPPKIQTRKLDYLAALHGFLNYYPHRALFDAITCLKVMSCYPFEEVVKWSKSPEITIIAAVSYEKRNIAKNLLYTWNPVTRLWTKRIKEFQLEDEIKRAEGNFTIDTLGDKK